MVSPQARATLIHILELQIQRRKQAVEDIKSSWLTLNNITTLYPFETEEHGTGEATCWYSFLKSDLDLAGCVGKKFEQFLPWLEGFYLICKETFIKAERRGAETPQGGSRNPSWAVEHGF
ncbi:hypothetical protein NC653_036249 [Populus alba x Populus x berolinensis]|uniref:Uncharacterized protein n=1 Tax=Populus alba x Populus x berolinensis TaxID=444605 RepID=A0AAD6LJS6_9ROSI|nr:hypothetical protein NC653_036249 [Populus alba x Populus x berolinensis]